MIVLGPLPPPHGLLLIDGPARAALTSFSGSLLKFLLGILCLVATAF